MFELIGRAYAQSSSFTLPTLQFVPSTTGFSTLLTTILTWILTLGGAIAVIYLVYGGILYITAGGDAEKATKGRTAVVNAIIGIVIILVALVLVTWVNNIVNNGSA